jgi:UPF0176 protein
MLKLISFYKFVKIKNPIDNKLTFKKFLIDNKLKGSIIFSLEGINGSVSGKQSNIDLLIIFLKKKFLFKDFDTINECEVDFIPFKRAKIKIKNEVVPLNELFNEDKYKFQNRIEPEDWNKIILANDVTVVDVRKSFESEIGTFEKAINPKLMILENFQNTLRNFLMIRIERLLCFAQVEFAARKLQAIYLKEALKMFINLKVEF